MNNTIKSLYIRATLDSIRRKTDSKKSEKGPLLNKSANEDEK